MQLRASFEFIAECLLQYRERFHVLPGKNLPVALDVLTAAEDEEVLVDEVRLGGKNILRTLRDDDDEIDLRTVQRRTISRSRFEEQLSENLVLPARLLRISYANLTDPPEDVDLPWGWTIKPRR